MLSVVMLLYFLREVIFPENKIAPFIAALLFIILPIHTEVVANVKSRDEILSLLFITLTFIKFHKYLGTEKIKDIFWAVTCFFMALLSKEYAITLILLLPISVYIFRKQNLVKSFKCCLPFIAPLGLYLLMRFAAVKSAAEGAENSIMNNPYLLASGMQKLATEFLVLFNYIKLLFFPHPLIVDYGFRRIPYTDFANPLVLVSILIYLSMIAGAVIFIKKRNLLGFGFAFYLLNILLVSNFFFNIGAPMGERLVYHSSFGFCVILAFGIDKGFKSLKPELVSKGLLATILLILVIASGFKTIDRNKDWKNNETLFLHDVVTAPNSVLINNDAAASCMSTAKHNPDTAARKVWLGKAIVYFTKAISLNPQYTNAYLNRGLCYFNTGIQDKALQDWDTVRVQNPNMPNLAKYLSIITRYYMAQAMKNINANNLENGIPLLNKAIEASPNAVDAWYSLGVSYLKLGKVQEGKSALQKVLQLNPNNEDAKRALAGL